MNLLGTRYQDSVSTLDESLRSEGRAKEWATADWLFILSFILIAVVYLLQTAGPLRLINDGIDYLLQASSALDGHGFKVHGAHSMRPPGYPALIYCLAKVGLGNTWAIVALNCVALGVGCFASYAILRSSFKFSRITSQLLVLLTLLSFVVVRNITFPLSDVCFFGVSALCLLGILRSENASARVRLVRLVLLAPLLVFCIELRTIGIVLVPGYLWAAVGGKTGAGKGFAYCRRHRLITILVLAVAVAVGIDVFVHSRYLQFNLPTFEHRGMARSIFANIRDHSAEWGEMFINVPMSRLPGFMELPVRILGVFAILMAGLGIWIRRKSSDSLMLYVLGTAAIVFVYPWFDTRLWLPVVPFLMAYVLLGVEHVVPKRIFRPAAFAYCSLFCVIGAIALAYSTRLTFAGPRFPELFGDGRLRPTYRYAQGGATATDLKDVNEDALYLLRRYDSRRYRQTGPREK